VKFCMNPITFGDRDFAVGIEASAKGGFDAVELWLPHVEKFLAAGHTPAEARAVLDDHGVKAAGACFVAGLIASAGEAKRKAFDAAKARFQLCQALGARTIVCVGDGPAQPTPDDYHDAAEQAREVGDLAASFGLTVGIEFVAGFPFVGTLATAARLVSDADHVSLGILFDCFHFWAGRSKMADFDHLRGVPIAFVHLNDALDLPREILRDSHRVLPGRGAFPLREIVGCIEATGFEGYYSVELFNEQLFAADPVEVATMAREACDQLAASL